MTEAIPCMPAISMTTRKNYLPPASRSRCTMQKLCLTPGSTCSEMVAAYQTQLRQLALGSGREPAEYRGFRVPQHNCGAKYRASIARKPPKGLDWHGFAMVSPW